MSSAEAVDPREAEWQAWEAKQLANRICPDSGERLLFDHPYSDSPPGRMSCAMCDCFGFDPSDPRIGKRDK